MILITSAAYVSPALISEFGKLPPMMLPVQNHRLYEHQVNLVNDPAYGDVFITLPNTFTLTQVDKKKLSDRGVTVIYVPEGISLGQSVVYALNVIGRYDENLYVFHGDTLFTSLTTDVDVYAVSNVEDDYSWTLVDDKEDSIIYSGFFSFSSISLLIRKIAESNYNFMSGVSDYMKEIPMKSIELPEWMDFGLVNSYYRSISRMTTQRVFNSLKVRRHSLTKYSKDTRKILAEANWFASVPKHMRQYIPSLWDYGLTDDGRGYYEIEYYYQSSLANLFVFARNPLFVWKEILNSCLEYINDEAQVRPADLQSITLQNATLYGKKTIERLKKYSEQSGVNIEAPWIINGVAVPGLMQIAEEMNHSIDLNTDSYTTMMHGDFCFSNILYDFKSKSIRVLDPRGLSNEGQESIYGDLRYDVAKLAHSIIGMYDYIICDNFEYTEESDRNVTLHFPQNDVISLTQSYFRKMKFAGYSFDELSVYPILVHLFLSMLPLHSDNVSRQKAFLANALRLYVEYKNQK